MSYSLKKPYTEDEKNSFIVRYNRILGLDTEETDKYLFALEKNEMMGEVEIDGELIPYPIINPNYEEEQIQKEKERIAKLYLTKREVFLALYDSKGLTPDVLRSQITDPRALIEFDYANDYYRFNPLIDSIGGMLGYSSKDLDYLFINKKFPEPKESEE